MAINISEKVQENLGYPPLVKIDPNSHSNQDKPVDSSNGSTHTFSQAAIPAVLTALYKYAQTDEGAAQVLSGNNSTDWAALLFNDTMGTVQLFDDYTREMNDDPRGKTNAIAAEAVRLAKEELKEDATTRQVKDFFSNQRNNILVYLPPSLHIGSLLNDDTLDDNTNKMEGPISSLMNSIGNAFNNPADESDAKQ